MKRNYLLILMLAGAALLTGAAVAFPKIFGIFEWVSMIPLVLVLDRCADNGDIKKRHCYAYGLLYFEIFYMVCFHFFLYMYPLDFTGLDEVGSVLAIAVAWLGLPLLQALFGGFVFVIYVSVVRSRLVKRFPIVRIFSLPVIYSFYEFTQTLGWWGVPWGRLPIGQTELILPVQTASLFGSYFITFVIVLVNCLILHAAVRIATDRKAAVRYVAAALAVFILNIGIGGALYAATRAKEKAAQTVTVGIVQGNYDSTDKWFAMPSLILNKHLDLTRSCAQDGAQIVIWAETALPFAFSADGNISKSISNTAKELGITVLVGCMQYTDDGDYNAILCYNPDGTVEDIAYYKRHLVPFGEYVPMRSVVDVVMPFLSELSMLAEDMSAGTEATVFDTDCGKFGSLICFDSIYEELSLDTVRVGAEIFAISTNDSWFSDSAGIHMHNAQARLRSVEFGRYTARCANTGLSTVISATGTVLCDLEPLTEGYLVYDAALLDGTTLYTVIGNTFVYVLGALLLAAPIYAAALDTSALIKKRREECGADE